MHANAAAQNLVEAKAARIEPNTIKRRGVGLRGHDPARSFPGLTLFAPDGKPDGKTVYLIDMEGNVVHTWDMPCPAGLTAFLTDRGTLFYNGYIPNPRREGSTFVGGAVMEVDWKGRILCEVRHPDHHHDGIRLRNGNVLLICAKPLPNELVSRIRGGRAGTEGDDGRIYGDYLVEMTIGGEVVWEWRCWEHLDPVEDGFTAVQDERAAWPMGNGISEMPDGNILLSFRANSTVVMIERRTGTVYWKLGAPPLSGQHAPHILANGNLLLFDNGPHRLDHSFPYSRVLEIDPATEKDRMEIPGHPAVEFLQPPSLECPAPAERQHAHQRGLVRPLLRGHRRRRRGLGIRESVLLRITRGATQSRGSCLSLHRRGDRTGACGDLTQSIQVCSLRRIRHGNEKKEDGSKVLLENEKARVFEVRFRPGDEHRSVPTTAFRVARLSGGKMMRTYADGSTKQVE